MKLILLFVILVAVLVLMPFASIWSLNTLFPVLAIPFNFDTWCAAVILGGVVGGGVGLAKK
jgi:hypothetical protein